MTIGSAETCDIRIREPNVLHKHARLICRQTLFYIRPLSAKALTSRQQFPRRRQSDMMLQHRDMITIAAWTMQFVEGALTPEAAGTLDGATRQAAKTTARISSTGSTPRCSNAWTSKISNRSAEKTRTHDG
jgi:predicted component of type VI protein secretion system